MLTLLVFLFAVSTALSVGCSGAFVSEHCVQRIRVGECLPKKSGAEQSGFRETERKFRKREVSHKISPLCEQAQLFFLYRMIPLLDRVQTTAVRFLSATRLKTGSVAGLHRMRCEVCLSRPDPSLSLAAFGNSPFSLAPRFRSGYPTQEAKRQIGPKLDREIEGTRNGHHRSIAKDVGRGSQHGFLETGQAPPGLPA